MPAPTPTIGADTGDSPEEITIQPKPIPLVASPHFIAARASKSTASGLRHMVRAAFCASSEEQPAKCCTMSVMFTMSAMLPLTLDGGRARATSGTCLVSDSREKLDTFRSGRQLGAPERRGQVCSQLRMHAERTAREHA